MAKQEEFRRKQPDPRSSRSADGNNCFFSTSLTGWILFGRDWLDGSEYLEKNKVEMVGIFISHSIYEFYKSHVVV